MHNRSQVAAWMTEDANARFAFDLERARIDALALQRRRKAEALDAEPELAEFIGVPRVRPAKRLPWYVRVIAVFV